MEASKMKVYCDLDGVLADFEAGVKNTTGRSPDEFKSGELWPLLGKKHKFFTTLPWMPDGKTLWARIKGLQPTVLSSAPGGWGARDQKKEWCKQELGQDVELVTVHNTAKKGKHSGDGKILIDDRLEACEAWRRGGGISIHHKDAATTIAELNRILGTEAVPGSSANSDVSKREPSAASPPVNTAAMDVVGEEPVPVNRAAAAGTADSRTAPHQPGGFKHAPEGRASAIPFDVLCRNLQKCAQVGRRVAKIESVLSDDIKRRVGEESLYPYLRLLIPKSDGVRGKYKLQEKSAANLIIEKLGLRGKPADRLRNYNDSEVNKSSTGDFAGTLEEVLKEDQRRSGTKHNMTVGFVNEQLDKLVHAKGDSERGTILYNMLLWLRPDQSKWFFRIIFADLKVGLKGDIVLPSIHPDMREEFQKTMDLRRVCSVFAGRRSSERVATDVMVGHHLQPMLSKKQQGGDLKTLEARFKGAPFVMEIKVDGDRMMAHKDGDKVLWFTRKAVQYDKYYGPVLSRWILSNVKADRCILDGEVVSYNKLTGRLCHFGHNKTHARLEADAATDGKGESHDHLLFYIVFDILHAEGPLVERAIADAAVAASNELGITLPGDPPRYGCLTEQPLAVRRRVLERLLVQEPHRLEVVHSETVKSGDPEQRVQALQTYFDDAVDRRGEEGLVLKHLGSHYEVGKRDAGSWIKLKPEYAQGVTLDVIILGGYFGESTRVGRVGMRTHFLIGVKNDAVDDRGMPTQFLVCGKAAGLTDEALLELNQRLEGKWQEFDRKAPLPSHLVNRTGQPARLTSDYMQRLYLVKPCESFVAETEFSEVITGATTGSGFTLRFPRFKRIRYDDKGWDECDTFATLYQYHSEGRSGMRRHRSIPDADGELEEEPVKHKKRKLQRTGRQVAERLRIADVSGLQASSAAFIDETVLEMCVLPPSRKGYKLASSDVLADGGDGSGVQVVAKKRKFTKQELETMIAQGGGTIVAHPTSGTFAAIASRDMVETETCKNYIASGKYNVVDFAWIIESHRRGTFRPPAYNDFLGMDEATKSKMADDVDEFGDHYTEPVDTRQLKAISARVEASRLPNQTRRGLRATLLDNECFSDEERAALVQSDSFFWQNGAVFYVDEFEDLGSIDQPPSKHLEDNEHFWSPAVQAQRLVTPGMAATAIGLDIAGATLVRDLCVAVTHVIVDRCDKRRFAAIRERLAALRMRAQRERGAMERLAVLDISWVACCRDEGRFVDLDGFTVALDSNGGESMVID